MAQIHPFPALRFNPARVKLAEVVTQPYDKITPAMQDRYYAVSPGNLVRIILGKHEASDNESENVYTRAAAYLSDWRRNGILCQDEQPSFYAYSQRFVVPGTSGPEYERRGFIGLGKIEEYDAGVVFRHEKTLSGPKVDRLNLLRATRAHTEQLFLLYSDPQGTVDSLLFSSATPDIDVRDEYGVQHRVWKVSDPAVTAKVTELMRDKSLIIADGHHRYETSLNYRNERRAQDGHAGEDRGDPYEFVMMTFVNMDAEGLVILPTHRVVFGMDRFDVAGMVEKLRPYFSVNPLRERVDASSSVRLLQEKGQDRTALLAVTAQGDFLLEAREDGAASDLLAGLSPRQQKLDVAQLHKIVLEYALGISEEDIRNQKHINYVREAGEAIERVQEGANAAFLMNPVSIGQMRDVALAQEVMPQKSTDFYPKLLSGLTMCTLE